MLSFKNNIKRCQYQADSFMRKNKVKCTIIRVKIKTKQSKTKKERKTILRSQYQAHVNF